MERLASEGRVAKERKEGFRCEQWKLREKLGETVRE